MNDIECTCDLAANGRRHTPECDARWTTAAETALNLVSYAVEFKRSDTGNRWTKLAAEFDTRKAAHEVARELLNNPELFPTLTGARVVEVTLSTRDRRRVALAVSFGYLCALIVLVIGASAILGRPADVTAAETVSPRKVESVSDVVDLPDTEGCDVRCQYSSSYEPFDGPDPIADCLLRMGYHGVPGDGGEFIYAPVWAIELCIAHPAYDLVYV